MKTDELIAAVNSLPVEDRAMVADRILRTLNPPESDIDKKWAVVANRRLAELRSGSVQAVPGDEVFARLQDRLSQ